MREQLDTIKHMHRLSGILVHPTSLPGEYGIGDFGPDAYRRNELSLSVLFVFRRSAAVDQPGASDGGRPFDRGGSAG